MGIRAKLFVLVFALTAAFVVSVATYFGFRSPVPRIETEQSTLSDLREALLGESEQASRIAWGSVVAELKAYQSADAQTTERFARLKSLTVLPRLDPSIKSTLDSIQTLETLLRQNADAFTSAAQALANDADAAYGSGGANATIVQLVTDQRLARTALGSKTSSDVSDFLTQLYIYSARIRVSAQVIATQYSTIDATVNRIEARGTIVSVVIIALLFAGALLFALVLANRIVRSIRAIEALVGRLASGDLSRGVAVRTRDEIGRLSSNLDRFIDALRGSVGRIQLASNESMSMRSSLVETTEQTSASATEIGASASSVDRRMSSLDDTVAAAAGAVRSIVGNIRNLDQRVQEQTAMVEQSTAAINEMIASIDNVTRIADDRREATEQLVRIVAAGGEKMGEAFAAVREIDESVGGIKDITGIIEGISGQTNLLAMNAAIEAAHAGDAGRGFSVVADEIRKLAEASAENSQQIGGLLKRIVERIEQASSSGEEMTTAFAEVEREVKVLSESLTEIFANMNELRAGGTQILQATAGLQEVSSGVMDGSRSINSSAGAIDETMSTVQRISSEVRSGMAEISAGIAQIAREVDAVLAIAGRLGGQGEALNREITHFRVEHESAGHGAG